MNIKLKINGRDASPDGLGAAVEDAVLAKVKYQMTERLKDVCCPEHGRAPKVEFSGDPLKNLKMQTHPCCAWMREETQRLPNQK